MQKETVPHAEGSPWRDKQAFALAQRSSRASRKKLSRLQKETLAHRQGSLTFAEGRRCACRRKPSRFHKEAFPFAEGKRRVCRRNRSRIHKESIAFANVRLQIA